VEAQAAEVRIEVDPSDVPVLGHRVGEPGAECTEAAPGTVVEEVAGDRPGVGV
jgi:hypothetical protein